MNKRLVGLLLSGPLVGVAALPALGATAISSTFNIGVYADADATDPSTFTQQTYSASQLGTLDPYAQSLTVTDTAMSATGAPGSLTVTSTAGATWTSANAGDVTWYDMGWSLATLAPAEALLNSDVPAGPVWSYTFTATGNGTFDLNYNVWANGDPFGLRGAVIDWSGPGGGLSLDSAFDPTASGTFSRALVGGQTYTVDIANFGNVYFNGASTTSGHMFGDFNWQIDDTAVPGPAALIPFLGGLVIAFRRRR